MRTFLHSAVRAFKAARNGDRREAEALLAAGVFAALGVGRNRTEPLR